MTIFDKYAASLEKANQERLTGDERGDFSAVERAHGRGGARRSLVFVPLRAFAEKGNGFAGVGASRLKSREAGSASKDAPEGRFRLSFFAEERDKSDLPVSNA